MRRLLIILMLVSLAVFGQLSLASFRRQSTYVIYDDLDNALSPITIFDIEGWRIYSNLSNLSTGTEELMNGTTDNTYVFGIVTPEIIQGMKISLLYGNTRTVTPNDVSLDLDGDGTNDVTGTGTVSGSMQEFSDINSDDQYDFRTDYFGFGSDYSDHKENAMLFNWAMDMGSGILGFSYYRNSFLTSNDISDSSTAQTFDLATNDQTFDSLDITTEASKNALPMNNFGLNYIVKDLGGYRVGFGLDMSFLSEKDLYDLKGFEDVDWAVNSPLVDTWTDSGFSKIESDLPIKEFGFGGRAYKNQDGNITDLGLSIGFGSGATHYEESERYWSTIMATNNNGNVETSITNSSEIDTANYKRGIFYYSMNGRWVRRLNKDLLVGFGLSFDYNKTTDTYDGRYEGSYVYSFNDGDNEPNDRDDYTSTYNYWVEYTDKETQTNAIISAPVGIELAVTKNKNWFIRFGAIAQKRFTSDVFEEIPENYQQDISIISYGDGTADTTVIDDYTIQGDKHSSYNETTETMFSYGLGWHPNENISIDFISMFDPTGTILDLSAIRSLRVSATIKVK